MEDYGFGSLFGGSPWDFGLGFNQPFGFGLSGPPTPPPVDLSGMASSFAQQGIRPDQFMANPQAAVAAAAPPPAPTATDNAWDPRPDVPIPGASRSTALPLSQAPVSQTSGQPIATAADATATPLAADTSAAGTTPDLKAAKEKSFADRLSETLRGVKMPTPPTPQTIRTPSVPEPKGNVKAGQLLAMLLNAAPQGAQAGLKLPPTLTGAIGGGR